jgi:hypothetical protein
VFVTVGAGDTFATVRILLKLLSANGIPLRTELVQRSRTWLRSYARHEEEQSLCRLIDRYVTSDATTDPTPIRVNGAPATPERIDPCVLDKRVSHPTAAC